MRISDIITKADQQRHELCQKCPRIEHSEEVNLKRQIKDLQAKRSKLVEVCNDLTNKCRNRDETIKSLRVKLEAEVKFWAYRGEREKFIMERIKKLFGPDAIKMIFNTVEQPIPIRKTEIKTVIRQRTELEKNK